MAIFSVETLKLLPAVVLAPLLVAPRGCYFGAADVPLGSNVDDVASGAGGTGSGNAGISASGTGGLTSEETGYCLEEITEVTWDTPTPFGYSRSEVQELLAGRRSATLTARDTPPTNVTLEFVGPIGVFFVASRRNPDIAPDIVVSCFNRMRAKTFARFVSDDGVFDETFTELDLDLDFVPAAPPGDGRVLSAGGIFYHERHEIRGSYSAPTSDTQCLSRLLFFLNVREDEFSGVMFDRVLSAPCGSTDPNVEEISAETAMWLCGGESCRLPANDTVVVEASSCDRFGTQVTTSGDEASFERSGDVLRRDEGYGCGCATRAEHVMAYTPTSPVELRLCHDDFADGCERFCGVSLSYDLARAFDRAGTREFRFVD
jgi:hypothetical protein